MTVTNGTQAKQVTVTRRERRKEMREERGPPEKI
jgi:hypothetical protein